MVMSWKVCIIPGFFLRYILHRWTLTSFRRVTTWVYNSEIIGICMWFNHLYFCYCKHSSNQLYRLFIHTHGVHPHLGWPAQRPVNKPQGVELKGEQELGCDASVNLVKNFETVSYCVPQKQTLKKELGTQVVYLKNDLEKHKRGSRSGQEREKCQQRMHYGWVTAMGNGYSLIWDVLRGHLEKFQICPAEGQGYQSIYPQIHVLFV